VDAPAGSDELGRLARAFNRLLERLKSTLAMQRRFMADASHELRTPVSVIQITTEVTLDRPDREIWEYRDALEICQEQSARLSRTVEGMLALARADAGGYRVTPRPIDVDDLVAECAKAASMLASAKQIHLDTAIEPGVSMRGDDALLRQLVTNLLDKAVRYTPPRGRVTVTVTRDETYVTISIADTGPGIAPADRERIFERFVRLDPARSASPGAGLGLPIARWIAAQHGGTLSLQPSTAAGSVFIARLPLMSVVTATGRGEGHGNTAKMNDA
jgi:signal transduction histidine kinase